MKIKGRKRINVAVKKKPERKVKKSIRPLTPEEQIMMGSNQGLIGYIAKNYLNQGLDFEDLCGEGQFGLINAIRKFEKTKGYNFSTYAVWWIWQSITRAIYDKASEIRIPVHQR